MTLSELDGIAGLGPKRRERLLEHFGSVPKLREADLEEISALAWLPDTVAVAVHERLHSAVPDDGEVR